MTATAEKGLPVRKAGLKKSEETRRRILEAALVIFRERGFASATMREIATNADVAVGAAYYYFESKDAIVMAFYQRAQEEMRPALLAALDRSRTLEGRLRGIVGEKLTYFSSNRALLGALTAHTDPKHPLSPFGEATTAIREEDVALFARAVAQSAVKLPKNVAPYLPRLLWMYQMGIILFWVYDDSPGQARTKTLFDGTLKILLLTLKLANFPLLRPMHKLAGELLAAVYGDR